MILRKYIGRFAAFGSLLCLPLLPLPQPPTEESVLPLCSTRATGIASSATGLAHRAIKPDPARHDTTAILYRPRADDFRPLYEADTANREEQSWEQYWRWVTTFYTGNVIARGWLDECAALLAGLDRHRLHSELIVAMNRLGRYAVAEWAKDNGVRLISSRDVFRWRNELRAVNRDPGEEADRAPAILAEVRRIESVVLARLDRAGSEGIPPVKARVLSGPPAGSIRPTPR